MFDLKNYDHAYLFGFLQTDGHHGGSTSGKGSVTVELREDDAGVLVDLQRILPVYSSISDRIRDTNFKAGSRSKVLAFFDQGARRELEELGLPVGRKDRIVGPPEVPFSEPDYVRGLLDGNGSVGFTGKGEPFVSITIPSRVLGEYYCEALERLCGAKRTWKPNSRDGVCNIMVMNFQAATLAHQVWGRGGISVERKREAAARVASWRPASGTEGRYGKVRQAWTPEDDAVVMAHPVKEAAHMLGRTPSSVANRRHRLNHA